MDIAGFYFASCPVCGSSNLYIAKDFGSTAIVCRHCGATTGFCNTFKECEDIWVGKGAKVLLPVYDGT